MKEFKIDFHCPAWAISYFMYGEAEGLSEQDKKEADDFFMKSEKYLADIADGKLPVIFNVNDDSNFFSNSPAFGLPCTCCECSFIVLKTEE